MGKLLTKITNTVLLAVKILTPLFSLTVPNVVIFFRLLDRKFNEDSKNLLKTAIFSLQVGFQVILSLTVLSNCVSGSSNFDPALVPNFVGFFRLLDRKFNEDLVITLRCNRG